MQDDGPGGFGGYRMAVLAVAADIHDGHRTASADRSNGSGPATLAVPGPGGFGPPDRERPNFQLCFSPSTIILGS